MIGHVFVSGFIQGVGFRWFVKREALKLGLTGWVKNLTDGRVEALFLGEEEKIEQMIPMLKKGNFLSEVKNVEVFSGSGQDGKFDSFEIIKS